MKLFATILAMLTSFQAKAVTCQDKIIIVQPNELTQFEIEGLIDLPRDKKQPVVLDPKLIDILTKKGRVRNVKAAASANCGAGLSDDIPLF